MFDSLWIVTVLEIKFPHKVCKYLLTFSKKEVIQLFWVFSYAGAAGTSGYKMPNHRVQRTPG